MIRNVGVIGAGVMGRGVSQSLAQAGMEVVLVDTAQSILDDARRDIKRALRFHGMLAREKGDVDASKVLARIHDTTDLSSISDVDFVVENVTERWETKEQVYPEIDRHAPAHAVFAVNTSCISITRIAALTGRPDRVVGMHFMNPVPLKPTVEVMRGHHTSDATLTVAKELLAAMGKDCVVVNDWPGFVSNRVLMLTINEAAGLVQDQVASAPDVDRIFKECFGHPMGPLETADLIGLDTILYSVEVLHESFADSKYRPAPLLKKMVDAGLLGRKSGEGFYAY